MNCVALCEPTCNDEDVCMLTTMTLCKVCPPSVCMNRVSMGIPPLVESNTKSGSLTSGGMIGGIVGGLLGLGLLVCLGVYLYIRRGKKKGKLPFAFTSGSGKNQEQFHHTATPPSIPHPGAIAALSHQHNEQQQGRGLEELDALFPRPTNKSLLSSPLGLNSINTPLFNNSDTNNVILPTAPTTTVPEEFEERIALQNKRISHILNNNPRLSQHQATFSQIQTNFDNSNRNRNSTMSYTTDEDSEYDYDDRISVARQVRPSTPTAQAVQVNRAKPQIMRVNSVRTSTGGGLNRSDSVRTILTIASPLPIVEDDLADQFPQTPNNRIEDPFQDKK